jgi:hypothetical protein
VVEALLASELRGAIGMRSETRDEAERVQQAAQ